MELFCESTGSIRQGLKYTAEGITFWLLINVAITDRIKLLSVMINSIRLILIYWYLLQVLCSIVRCSRPTHIISSFLLFVTDHHTNHCILIQVFVFILLRLHETQNALQFPMFFFSFFCQSCPGLWNCKLVFLI